MAQIVGKRRFVDKMATHTRHAGKVSQYPGAQIIDEGCDQQPLAKDERLHATPSNNMGKVLTCYMVIVQSVGKFWGRA